MGFEPTHCTALFRYHKEELMKPDIVPEVMFDNFRGRVCVV